MSRARKIEVSSRATGRREFVTVYVYDDVEDLRRAAHRFNGLDNPRVLGVCQATRLRTQDRDGHLGKVFSQGVIVRLAVPYIRTSYIVHEMSHAAAAIYGQSLRGDERAVDLLHHHNETLAYLHSDLTTSLVDRMHKLGYYDEAPE